MGFVVQGGGLFPHLSAHQNATIMAQYLDWERSRIQKRLDLLVELTRFPVDRLSNYPIELSGGERQRVSLIRALMLDPDVLLLDEPLGALDPMTRFELQTDLRRIFGQLRKTVVLVTHDLSEAAFFADQIVLLRAGRVVQRGPLDQLVRSPADSFVTHFINAQRPPLALTSHGQ
jgi:osmoprotectant transport system ATP-binding protein